MPCLLTASHKEYLSEKECLVVGRVGAHCGNIHIAKEKSWITDNAIYSKWCSNHFILQYAEILLSSKNLNNIAGGSGQPYVSQALLNPLVIGIPSTSEQKVVVKEVERIFSIIEKTQKLVESELKRSQSLTRCSWLRKLPNQDKYICRIHDVKPEHCRAYPKSKKHALKTGCRGFED